MVTLASFRNARQRCPPLSSARVGARCEQCGGSETERERERELKREREREIARAKEITFGSFHHRSVRTILRYLSLGGTAVTCCHCSHCHGLLVVMERRGFTPTRVRMPQACQTGSIRRRECAVRVCVLQPTQAEQPQRLGRRQAHDSRLGCEGE